MKKIIVLYFYLFVHTTYSQVKSTTIYDDAISLIKKSEMFTKYSVDNKSINIYFEVSQNRYSICEFDFLYKGKISPSIIDYCQQKDWINEKVVRTSFLKNKSDKGKKSFNLRFTTIIDNYIIAELKYKSKTNNSLVYLFKVNGDKIELIKVDNVFYD